MSATEPLFTVRRAQPDDLPAIEACVQAAYEPWVAVIGMKPGPMLEDYAEVLRSRTAFVSEHGGRVVGLLVLFRADDCFTLENIAVHPDFSGQGLGRHLLLLAEREAIADGHVAIHLYTHERMVRNIALYEKVGYVTYERRTVGPYTRVFMRKALGPC